MKRLTYIDAGKGLTAFLVFIGHVFYGIYESPILNEYNQPFLVLVQMLYVFHMPVFFALSGMLFKPVESVSAWFSYLKKKSISLLIPYVFFCFVWFLTSGLAGSAARNHFGLMELMRIPLRPIAISWFLYILWLITAIYSLLSIYLSKKQLLGVSAVLYLVSLLFPVGNYLLQRTMCFGVCFVLGYCLKDKEWLKSKSLFLLNIALFVGYLLIWSQFNGVKISYSKPGLDGLVYILSILLSVKLFEVLSISKIANVFEKLGLYAIEIYLYHSVIVSAYRIILIKLGYTDIVFHVIVGIPITFGLTILATYLSRKFKFIDFFLHPLQYWRR
jgi:fucose 4-O-acetylase-like acetyltransferase